MAVTRMDNVGIVVEDIDAAIKFFTELGLTLEGRMPIEGDWAGRVTGVHLHYEVRLRDEPVDPMRYLDGGRDVRNASSPLTSVRPAAIDVSRHASARRVGP